MFPAVQTSADLFGMMALLLVLGCLAGHFAAKIRLPSVLGEIGAGVALALLFSAHLPAGDVLHGFGEVGIAVLLFQIGLETDATEIRRVGSKSLAVAVTGIFAPVALGLAISYWLQGDKPFPVHLFTAATLAATSVGLTVRILRDLGYSNSAEAKIVLGAAILDDILGLVLLGIVTGIAATWGSSSTFSVGAISWVIVRAAAFVALALGAGATVVPMILNLVGRMLGRGNLLLFCLAHCFIYAFVADFFGLAPVIGAFFAGLVLKQERYSPLVRDDEGSLDDQLASLARLLVPLFFVLIGMRVDLSVFRDPPVVVFALALTVAAVAGKVVSGLAAGRGVKRLLVGVAMIPRGEVGLIFATIGLGIEYRGSPLLSPGTFGALVGMVVVTTLIAPFWLGAMLRRRKELV